MIVTLSLQSQSKIAQNPEQSIMMQAGEEEKLLEQLDKF